MPDQPAPVVSFMQGLLELLATDAPAEDFGALAAGVRLSGADACDLAEVDKATSTALRVRRSLRKHRRREMELTALFDTAGDLAALRDLDAVLNSIVRRARMLLGTDTAYLTLIDRSAGDTYMRVTDGSVSVLFQELRLDLGEGLGGLVAQTARPYSSTDYRGDARFHHTGSIDDGVLDEGLVAILGVPLLLGSGAGQRGTVIGVLFAADRNPRAFSQDETALLCSLAAHAAIAIDTAETLADLASANALVREHAAAVQRAEEAHDRLTDLVLRGGDVPEVAAATARLLGGEVTIHGPEGRALAPDQGSRAAADATTAEIVDCDRLVAAAADSHRTARAVLRDGRWICAVLAGQELLGCMVLHGHPALGDSDRRLFERASVVTALRLLLRRTVTETENRIRGDLITDLLTAPDRDPLGLAERGRRLGIDLDRPRMLLVARTGPAAGERLAAAVVRYLFGGDSISAEHAGSVVMLLPCDGTAPGRVAQSAAARLTRLLGAPVTVAAAGPATGVRAIAAAHDEATRCLRAMRVLGRTGGGASALELGFLGVLLGNGHDVDGFVSQALGPLLEYDLKRGTELVHTLDVYFTCGGNHTRTKEALHVHVNTVVQRLERIETLLGRGWNAPERALELQLALQLKELSHSHSTAAASRCRATVAAPSSPTSTV